MRARVIAEAIHRLAVLWKLDDDAASKLLGVDPDDFRHRLESLLEHQLTAERASLLLGIYKGLQILLLNEEQANTWMHRRSKRLNMTPLSYLLERPDRLWELRRYLDEQLLV